MNTPTLSASASLLMLLACGDKGTDPADANTGGGGADTGHTPSPYEMDDDGDGLSEAEGDCDDTDPEVNPSAEEVCDGIDNDCSGVADDGASDASVWYADADGDGYGAEAYAVTACEAPAGHVDVAGDCHDQDAAWHPGAVEDDCDDPSDYNCDGSVGNTDADQDGFTACEECNDNDDTIHPDADEVCDLIDNDCSGEADDNAIDAEAWYADSDEDTYGDPNSSVAACEQPEGFVADDTDCDDTTEAVNPAVTELCNDIDDNCDGTVDEDEAQDAATWYADADADGAGDPDTSLTQCAQPAGYISDDTDCDDTEPLSRPDLPEVCDGLDNDCDGTVDNDDALDAPTWYHDFDSDTYGDATDTTTACSQPTDYVADDTDCDDDDDGANPAETEVCDGTDNDCDGTADNDDASDAGTWYADSDSDSFGDPDVQTTACSQPTGYVADNTDCDDGASAVNTAETETCDNIDNDCDGTVDEDDASDALTWYADTDGDGFGDPTITDLSCDQPSGYVSDDTDCNDTSAAAHLGLAEVCDGIDNDCDGTADNDDAVDASTWYHDFDSDTYGDPTDSTTACSQPTDYVADGTDCDDSTSAVSPTASETCNGVDDDCDGHTDEEATDATTYYADADSDGYGAGTGYEACSQPSGYIDNADDCDDTHPQVYPGAAELCDGVANDCDTATSWVSTDEDGVVSFESSAGAWSDLSTTWTSGTSSSAASPSLASDGTVWVCDGTYYVHVDVTADVEIMGLHGADTTILDGASLGTVVTVTAASVGLDGLTLSNGSATNGGALSASSSSDLVIADLIIKDSEASSDGGGIYLSNSNLEAEGLTLSDCDADDGAGLYLGGTATADLANSTFSANVAANYGGGVYIATNATVDLDDVTIEDGDSYGGGGIYNTGALTIVNVTIRDNVASWRGGGILDGDTVTATDSVISGNEGGYWGGGILTSGTLTLTDTDLTDNRAGVGGAVGGAGSLTMSGGSITGNEAYRASGTYPGHGGAIYTQGSTEVVDLDDVDISGNTGAEDGGAIHLASSATGTIDDCTLDNNYSGDRGGGVYLRSGASVTITGGSISGNTAADDGGAISIGTSSSSATLDTVEIENNAAYSRGGAVYVDSSAVLDATSTTFVDNIAADDGGAISATSSTASTTLDTCEFDGNFAGDLGGALYVQNATVTTSDFSDNDPDDSYNSAFGDSDTWGTSASFTCTSSGCN